MTREWIDLPDDPQEASTLVLTFMLDTIAALDVDLTSTFASDPVQAAKQYIAGELSEDLFTQQSDAWWAHLEALGCTFDVSAPEGLKARLALCLLFSTPKSREWLSENVSWFIQFLWKQGRDTQQVLDRLDDYFPREHARSGRSSG